MRLTAVERRYGLWSALALLAWMGLILFLSSRSFLSTDLPGVKWLGQYQDEVGHLGEYGVLGMLAYAALRSFLGGGRTFILGLAFCMVFALGDEAFQSFTPNRAPELKDIALDGAGALAGLVVLGVVGPRLRGYWPRRVHSGGATRLERASSWSSQGPGRQR
ncbi:MAG: VanZ family protein [Chloroflexi bacterium]|nr:VanZ family protein [Chloroflexota bacterium]